MEYTVNLTLDKEYFSEAFNQSIRYANKWRKGERIVGVIFLAFGVGLIAWTEGRMLTPTLLIIFGSYELSNPLFKKPLWVRRQMKSKVANGNVEIVLSESGIISSGPYSKGTIAWEGVERIVETPKGLFIWPQKGIHIYLPKSVTGNDIIQYIHSKSV